MEVPRHKGPGLIESIYERCLLRELDLRSIPEATQKLVRVEYKALVFNDRCVSTCSWMIACWSS